MDGLWCVSNGDFRQFDHHQVPVKEVESRVVKLADKPTATKKDPSASVALSATLHGTLPASLGCCDFVLVQVDPVSENISSSDAPADVKAINRVLQAALKEATARTTAKATASSIGVHLALAGKRLAISRKDERVNCAQVRRVFFSRPHCITHQALCMA